MEIDVLIDEGVAKITMTGPFRFDINQRFKEAYSPLLGNADVKQITLEMSKVDYLDCSALGMLLLLKELASRVNKKLKLQANYDLVSKFIDAANFAGDFDIEYSTTDNSAEK